MAIERETVKETKQVVSVTCLFAERQTQNYRGDTDERAQSS